MLTSPTSVAPTSLPSRITIGLVDAVLGLGVLHELVVGMLGRLDAHRGDVDTGDLQLGGHPRTVIGGSACRRRSGDRPAPRPAPTAARRVRRPGRGAVRTRRRRRRRRRRWNACGRRRRWRARRSARPAAPGRRSAGSRPRPPSCRSRARCRRRTSIPASRPSSVQHLGGALARCARRCRVFSTDLRRIAPAGVVELGVHQRRAGVHDVDGQSAVLQSACGFQAEQAATDDDGLGPGRAA